MFWICIILIFTICNIKAEDNFIDSEPYLFVTNWGSEGNGNGQFKQPRDIIVDIEGNVYITDPPTYRIQKFDSSGNFITVWGSKGSEDGQFNNIEDIAVDEKGNIYISDFLNHRIQKFDSSGNFITMWGSKGDSEDQFTGFGGIAIDVKGNILVKDCLFIKKFDSEGNFISTWYLSGGFKEGILGDNSGFTGDINLDPLGNTYLIYITHGYDLSDVKINERILLEELVKRSIFIPYIVKYNSSGKFIKKICGYGKGNEKFSTISGLTIDSKGYIYITDCNSNCIKKFDENLNFITKCKVLINNKDSQRNRISKLTVDPKGNIYIIDRGNCSIYKFTPNPNYKERQ